MATVRRTTVRVRTVTPTPPPRYWVRPFLGGAFFGALTVLLLFAG